MLLFRPEHVHPIVDGKKTQTRRVWKRARVRVDAIHACYTRPPFARIDPGQAFARVRITGVRTERCGDISLRDARREGYRNREAYLNAFADIHGISDRAARRLEVFVVDFVRGCALCGCTDDRACVGDDGRPCSWVLPDLCSTCMPAFAEELRARGVRIRGERTSSAAAGAASSIAKAPRRGRRRA